MNIWSQTTWIIVLLTLIVWDVVGIVEDHYYLKGCHSLHGWVATIEGHKNCINPTTYQFIGVK